MGQRDRKPWRLKLLNPLFMMLTRMGLPVGIVYVLTVTGRKTGKPYSTPVSVFTLDGQRYIVSHSTWGWVKNAHATREGLLQRGKRTEPVQLIELPLNQRIPVVRAFPKLVPHGVSFFGLPPDPDAFEQAAAEITAFRVEPLTAAGVGAPVNET